MEYEKREGFVISERSPETIITDIQHMADARVAHFTKHMRASNNEWILQEMEEWCDEVQTAAHASWKAGIISQDLYQTIVSTSRDGWVTLVELVREHEEREEYIKFLCGI